MHNPPAAPVNPLPVAGMGEMQLKPVKIGLRSRFIVWLLRVFLRPILGRMMRGSNEKLARTQLFMAGQVCRNSYGLALDYRIIGGVPGYFVGNHDPAKRMLLYLHGGAFILPAVPNVHVRMVARMCRELDAVGFVVDYRLAPFNKYPAPLDDCERAYRGLLDLGYAPERLAVAGESAGGNLLLGLLQRIRKGGLAMPCCGVPISPGTETGRIHGPPSRALRMRKDPMLPMGALARIGELYAGEGVDSSDPELSPLYADCRGFPPLFLLASDNEVLLDDAVLFTRQARQAGVDTRLDVWPVLPHAFPLFAAWFPEVKLAQDDIIAFMRQHLK